MQIHPTRPTIHVALAGALLLVAGAFLRRADVAAFGGAVVVAVAAFRTAAEATVARIRGAGFEMVWLGEERVIRMRRGESRNVTLEIRNRGNVDARGVGIRLLAAPSLTTRLLGGDSPDAVERYGVELLANSRLQVHVKITALRVGRFGIHGLTVDVRGIPVGGDALYEAPLMFANPLGVEVVPAPLRRSFGRSGGGSASTGRRANARRLGRGDELRELREHVPGDAFKRIAWKPSARRGKLIVRETDDEQNTVMWIVVDASSEHWGGGFGRAPLDFAFDEVQGLAFAALDRGEALGLVLVTGGGTTFVTPSHGERQKQRVEHALIDACSFASVQRSVLEENEIVARCAEHLRPLDGHSAARRPGLAELVARVDGVKGRAPFDLPSPEGRTATEARLRKHLADFGIEFPPRPEGERESSEPQLFAALARIERLPRGEVHLFMPPSSGLKRAMTGLRRGRTRVVVHLYELAGGEPVSTPFEAAVQRAVGWRSDESLRRCQKELRALGIRTKLLASGPHPREEDAHD